MSLQWSDSDKGITSYVIERNLTGSTAFATIVTLSGKVKSFSDAGLPGGQTFYYRMRAYKQSSISPYSGVASAVTTTGDTTPPSVPASLTTSPMTCREIGLSWTASTDTGSGLSSYNIYRNGAFLKQVSALSTTTSDSSLNGSTTYSYSVSAIDNAQNQSAQSSPSSSTTPVCPDSIPPTIPTALSATASSCQQIDLIWNASTDADSGVKGYNVYQNGVLRKLVLAPSTSTSDSGLSATTTYSYAVKALDNAGNESGASNTISATTPACSGSGSGTAVSTLADSGTMGDNSTIKMRGRMAEIGNRRALLYARGYTQEKWLYLEDDLGNTSQLFLPDLTGDVVFNAEYVFTGDNELWIFSSNGQPAYGSPGAPGIARQYALQGSPLPTSATLISKVSFGDSASGAGSLIKLRSGGLVALWYRPNPNVTTDPGTNWVDLGFAYRSPTGAWSTVFPVRVEGLPNHQHSLTLAQHPADDSIWAFSKGDSFQRLTSIHLSETTSGLRLDSVNAGFITQSGDGLNGPEGELPYLVAVPDASRNAILLAYQNNQVNFFSAAPFVKGAYISVAQIASNGTRTFLTLPVYVERVSTLGLVATPDKISLAYRSVDSKDLSFDDVYTSSYSSGKWSTPLFLGTTSNDPYNLIAYGLDHVLFALGLPDRTVRVIGVK